MKPTSAPLENPGDRNKRIMTKSPYSSDTIESLFSTPPAPDTKNPLHPVVHRFSPLDSAPLQTAMDIGFKNPRVSFYSPMTAAALEYLDRTTPKFCKSEMVAKLMDQTLKEQFPDLWNAISAKALTEPAWIEINQKRRKVTRGRL